jgi:L-amino acid N-acyltransferase YncA
MLPDVIQIRSAATEDSQEIARIWLDGVRVAAGASGPPEKEAIASFEARIRQPQGKSGIWVAVSSGKVVGWQGLQDFGITQISRVAQSSTYIAHQWHAKGVGRKLLCYAQERARERGIDVVVGWIKTDNKASLALVSALGWKFVGILPRNNDSEPELAYYAYAVPKEQNRLDTDGVNLGHCGQSLADTFGSLLDCYRH